MSDQDREDFWVDAPLFRRFLWTDPHSVSLTPATPPSSVFSSMFQPFYPIAALLDSSPWMLACHSGYFLSSGNNLPPKLKAALVLSDIMSFTSSKVTLRCCLWCKICVFVCWAQTFAVGFPSRRHVREGLLSVSNALAAFAGPRLSGLHRMS